MRVPNGAPLGLGNPGTPLLRRLAAPADAFTRPGARERRLAHQTPPRLGLGAVLGFGFLVRVLCHRKGVGNKSPVSDQIAPSTPCIYGVGLAFVQAHVGCVGRVHRRARRWGRAIGPSRRLVDPVLARALSKIASTFAKPAVLRGRAASEIGSGSATSRLPGSADAPQRSRNLTVAIQPGFRNNGASDSYRDGSADAMTISRTCPSGTARLFVYFSSLSQSRRLPGMDLTP